MPHNHILGAWADYDGNVHYEYESTEQLYLVDIFEFCPVCGMSNANRPTKNELEKEKELKDKHEKLYEKLSDIRNYSTIDRIDVICGSPIKPDFELPFFGESEGD